MNRAEAIEQLQNCKDLIKQNGQDYLDERDFPLLYMAIKALQGDMYCPNCGVRLVPENEYLEPTPTHGRLIDADALYASIAMDTYLLTDRINSRDYGMFLVGIKQKIDNAPTVQADRPHGEWKVNTDDSCGGITLTCSECGEQFNFDDADEVLDFKEHAHFCINCGAKTGGEDE